MSKAIKITKGLNIRLQGEASKQYGEVPSPETFAIKPPDFHGLTPKVTVKPGDEVKAGTVIFYDKYNEDIKFVSPVSGEVAEIVRGEKRRVLEVRILADKKNAYESFSTGNPLEMDRDAIISSLLTSGAWPFIRQRPFATLANPTDKPKAIIVSATDTHPLAPDNDFIIESMAAEFQVGMNALSKLTEGELYLTMVSKSRGDRHADAFVNVQNASVQGFRGPHPAGNVGVQIHQLDPIDKGDVVWYIAPQDVAVIGRLFTEGKFEATRVLALTGSEVKTPQYYKTILGANIGNFVKDNVIQDNVRYVSGNCLTGLKVDADGYLGYYDSQITVLPEGDEYKFQLTSGWLGPGFDKFSLSKTFPTAIMPESKRWRLDTNLNGEERAFVVTGQYEQVFPFDIYPVQLVKACIVNDIDIDGAIGDLRGRCRRFRALRIRLYFENQYPRDHS